MPYGRLPKPPEESKLAINVPAKGMHGYLPQLSGELEYWKARNQTAFDYADTILYGITRTLAQDIGEVEGHTPVWERFGVTDRGLNHGDPGWQSWDRGRRDILGVLALSKLYRDLFPPQHLQRLTDYFALAEDRAEKVGLFMEPSARDANNEVLDTRVHMSGAIMDIFLEDTFDPQTEGPAVWYRASGPEGELYLRRQAPADPTPYYRTQAIERAQLDFDNMQTLFPYLPSRQ